MNGQILSYPFEDRASAFGPMNTQMNMYADFEKGGNEPGILGHEPIHLFI